MLGLLSFYRVAEPVLRLVMGFSVFNLDGQTSLLPYEMVSLTIESLAWCSMLVMISLEMHIYIREFRWYVRFGVIYVLVGEAVMLNLILSMRDHYQPHRSALYLCISTVFCQVIFGILLSVYVPNLDPFPGYTMIHTDPLDSVEYETLPEEERVCPERRVNIFSRIYFGWMTPLMQQGYKRPITEKDVWKLDYWDRTEELIKMFASTFL
ncbi:hypothetical protein EUGRSUZ_D00231 [Eucalyptus grandis]|uniref:Uncharacterized protein n=2 Tax=Eucalyptus grandis TaxID=71139 RepID=A0A059CD30_EUCGR|nr:hypothetical protein EUGRSUZ_D00231 [Eucalyptus grandis]